MFVPDMKKKKKERKPNRDLYWIKKDDAMANRQNSEAYSGLIIFMSFCKEYTNKNNIIKFLQIHLLNTKYKNLR